MAAMHIVEFRQLATLAASVEIVTQLIFIFDFFINM
jgi:hypothetical protein